MQEQGQFGKETSKSVCNKRRKTPDEQNSLLQDIRVVFTSWLTGEQVFLQ